MHIRITSGFPFLFLFFILYSCSESSRVYFVNSGGDDSDSGRTPETAWRTVNNVNNHSFVPGDQVLFRGGDEFTGPVIFDSGDKAASGKRIVISSYGNGKAIIRGNDKEGFIADSCNYLTVENLEFTGLGRNSGNSTDGIVVTNSNAVNINNLDVYGFQHSGLHLHKCDDARITKVYAHNNGFAGIHITGNTGNDPVNYDNHNLYIGYCVAENNPGDPTVLTNHSGNGILASSVKAGLIEYCEAFNNGWDMIWNGNGPVGIWIWDCTEVTIQYCIAHHNRTNPIAADGGGFDFDGGVSNSVIQYCISHNNEGAGYGLYEFGAAKPWENNIIRYNISLNDGKSNAGALGIWKGDNGGIIRNCEIYNNTFYNSNPGRPAIWLHNSYPGFRFRNNVFVYRKSFISTDEKNNFKLKDEVFQRNLFWNLDGDKSFEGYPDLMHWAKATGKEMMGDSLTGLFMDPGLSDPETLVLEDPEKINPQNLNPFYPLSWSPLINSALDLKELFGLDPGTRDICGTPIPSSGKFDIGAIEVQVK